MFSHLHVHSCFSFLDGGSTVAALVERARDCGYEALALTDSHGLYGAVRFHQAAVAAGIRPIVGAELSVTEGARKRGSGGAGERGGRGEWKSGRVEEWKRIRLISRIRPISPIRSMGRRATRPFLGSPIPHPPNSTSPHHPPFPIPPFPNLPIPLHLFTSSLPAPSPHPHRAEPDGFQEALAVDHAGAAVAREGAGAGEHGDAAPSGGGDGRGGTYLPVGGRAGTGGGATAGRETREGAAGGGGTGRDLSGRSAFSSRCRTCFIRTARRSCASSPGSASDSGCGRGDEQRPPGEQGGVPGPGLPGLRAHADHGGRAATRARSERRVLPEVAARHGPPLSRTARRGAGDGGGDRRAVRRQHGARRLSLPRFCRPAEGETHYSQLCKLCWQGAPERYPGHHAGGDAPPASTSWRSSSTLGFAPYFLVMWDIVRCARARGIRCAGRGSAADSLVTYVLRITEVDPIAHGLLFERFLHPAAARRAGHRHRLRRQPPRRGDRVRLPALREGARGDGLHRQHPARALRRARPRQGARLPAGGDRPLRQGPAPHLRRRASATPSSACPNCATPISLWRSSPFSSTSASGSAASPATSASTSAAWSSPTSAWMNSSRWSGPPRASSSPSGTRTTSRPSAW